MTQPDYQVSGVSMANTAELIGPLPLVAPPVLGDWSEADPAEHRGGEADDCSDL